MIATAPASTPSPLRLAPDADTGLTLERTWHAGRAVEPDVIGGRMESIHAALAAGDIDDAYGTFTDWIRQESRYAGADHKTNMVELVKTMLEMMSWMHERVPRSMVKVASCAAA